MKGFGLGSQALDKVVGIEDSGMSCSLDLSFLCMMKVLLGWCKEIRFDECCFGGLNSSREVINVVISFFFFFWNEDKVSYFWVALILHPVFVRSCFGSAKGKLAKMAIMAILDKHICLLVLSLLFYEK